MFARWTGAVVCALAIGAYSRPVFADARSKARRSFEEGMRLISQKKLGPGIESLIRANSILPHADVQFNIARACVDAGLIPEAIQWFETYLQQPTPPPDEAEVRETVRSLRARIAPEARSEESVSPPGEAPSEEGPPRLVKPLPLPKETTRDIERIEQLAKDVRPLSEERAKELSAIALRMRELAAIAQSVRGGDGSVLAQNAAGGEDGRSSGGGAAVSGGVGAAGGGGGGGSNTGAGSSVLSGTELSGATNRGATSLAGDPAASSASSLARGTPLDLGERGLRSVEEYEEREVVTAATRQAARAQDAPAVVWVITQQEIRQRGYESVAEALRAVAGLHVIDDHVFIDVGVRGVHAGLRGMSRIIKVLVDDHPVSFRPTSGNLLGLEMIPIRAIDRIELIRGPASALYGANAFLGVLQIVTRRGGDIRGGSLAGRGGFSTSARDATGGAAILGSGSGDVVIGTREGDVSILMAAQISRLNRSGLELPATSPFINELGQLRRGTSGFCAPAEAGQPAEPCEADTSTPLSMFGSLEYDAHRRGTFTLQAGLQKLESHAEWLDFGALTHYSKVALSNFWVRAGFDLEVSDEIGFRAFTSYSQGGPIDENRIRPLEAFSLAPNQNRHLTEDFQSKAIYSGVEARWELERFRLSTRVGADLDVDAQSLATAHAVFDEDEGTNNTGNTVPIASAELPDKTFTDVGLYLQVSSSPVSAVDLIGGLRYDYHNLYGSSVNGRLGSVFRLSRAFYVKALYGSSFRAPAADQLYHGSAYIGDTTGCLDYQPCEKVGLKPQTAHTGEVVIGVALEEMFSAQATVFVSFVDDLIISFPNNTNSFVTTNAGTYLSKGLELETSLKLAELSGLRGLAISAHAFAALVDTTSDIPQSLFEPAESIRAEYREASLFPNFSAGGGLDVGYIPAHVGLYVEGRFVGPRRASGSNLALSLGDSNYDNDNLPGYFELDANLSTRDLYVIGAGETVLSVRVTDILGMKHAEGGYRGWDIPAVGRMVFFRVIQEF